MTPDASEAIIAYIRQWQGTYTREAITQQLQDAGYDPAAIEAAWSRLDAETAAAGPPAQEAKAALRPVRPLGRGMAIAAFVIIWLAILGMLGILQLVTTLVLTGGVQPGGSKHDLADVLNVLFVVFVLGLLAGGIFFLARRQSLGRVLAVVGAIAFVWSVVIAGICFGPPR